MFEQEDMASHFAYFSKHSGMLYLFAVHFENAANKKGKENDDPDNLKKF